MARVVTLATSTLQINNLIVEIIVMHTSDGSFRHTVRHAMLCTRISHRMRCDATVCHPR